jgi:hypothetical protein
VSSLIFYLLLCCWPNTINHDTQQDANSENKYTTVNVMCKLSHIANTLEYYDFVGSAGTKAEAINFLRQISQVKASVRINL